MRILMLGWEFPPFISGGLGTACRGLTDALKRTDVRVLFVLPRSVESAAAAGMAPGHVRYASAPTLATGGAERVTVAAVASTLTDPYCTRLAGHLAAAEREERAWRGRGMPSPVRVMGVGAEDGYEGDLVGKIQAYAERCVLLARRELFDVIHAHDWMTYPAAIAISELSARPLVAHVHATEFDRSNDPTNGTIYEIERRGMHAAARVLAVSRRTRDTIVRRYGVPGEKVTVVHNGIDRVAGPVRRRADGGRPVVLFLGRITRQKGPLFFVQAAARVAARVPGARFVMAGAGDQLPAAMALALELGIADRVEFVGFLRGDDVDRAYERAAVYVMPSVSEPFGLTALEAASHGVPVIVSRSSGVAEVLERGSLKVDYWDVELMARMIVSVLTNRRLAESLVREGAREIAAADWDRAARRCVQSYYEVTGDRVDAPGAVAAGVGAGA